MTTARSSTGRPRFHCFRETRFNLRRAPLPHAAMKRSQTSSTCLASVTSPQTIPVSGSWGVLPDRGNNFQLPAYRPIGQAQAMGNFQIREALQFRQRNLCERCVSQFSEKSFDFLAEQGCKLRRRLPAATAQIPASAASSPPARKQTLRAPFPLRAAGGDHIVSAQRLADGDRYQQRPQVVSIIELRKSCPAARWQKL